MSGALSELRKFFCYLNHVSLSKQHLPIQARQQLPHLLPRLHQRPTAVVTVSLPSFSLLLLLCGHKYRVARCFWHLVKLPSGAVKTFVLLSLRCCFYCCCCCCSHFAIFIACCGNIKHFHRSIRNCCTLFDYAVLYFYCSWSFRVFVVEYLWKYCE